MGEFELIRHYFATTASRQDNVVLGIGDDCALLMPPEGQQLAVSIDTLVEGIHFPVGMAAEHIATRLLGSAVSDLAAMGARPAWFTLALTLPQADPQWLEAFACALAQHALELDIVLVGGDTTRGPLVLSVQVHGFVEPDKALYRSAAREGDLIAVSGTLGDSHAGLQSLQTKAKVDLAVSWLQQRFYRPEPRVELALALAPHLHAAIDISDGLCADLQHILNSSQVGADIHLERLPLSEALCHWCTDAEQRIDSALAGGDDYELCFTLPPSRWDHCVELAAEVGVQITCIGEITDSLSLRLLNRGQIVEHSLAGYDHFKEI
ncbi:thiamine-phosphate kinase [Nitrincola sp. MINF-07-Sa-05]|uniref:thiamine-phosphate kinase n=1 Tax=Nitrincola salilacus TaxID=3400273 RepID=UPI003917BF81